MERGSSTDRRLTLVIERREPIRGRVAGHDGQERPFSGWMGLVSALEVHLDGRGDEMRSNEGGAK